MRHESLHPPVVAEICHDIVRGTRERSRMWEVDDTLHGQGLEHLAERPGIIERPHGVDERPGLFLIELACGGAGHLVVHATDG